LEFEFFSGEARNDGSHDKSFAGVEFELGCFFGGESGERYAEGSSSGESVGLGDEGKVRENWHEWFAGDGDEGEGRGDDHELQIVIYQIEIDWFQDSGKFAIVKGVKKGVRKLSTIELTILGIFWTQGPCTTYAVMKGLSQATSTYYQSRAGTTYSVTKRLLGMGYLAGEDELEVTELGAQVLRDWVSTPVPRPDVAFSSDLIRLRFYFLGLLTVEERIAYVDNCLKELREFLVICDGLLDRCEAIDDQFGVMASASAVLENRARIRWLELARVWLSQGDDLERPWAKTVRAALGEF
jgi:DNA-binding PadR family transcriptional regulator